MTKKTPAKPGASGKGTSKKGWGKKAAGAAFRELGGDGFQTLMHALIGAECQVAGLSPRDFQRVSATNRADGGVDGYVSATPRSPTDRLKNETVFQAKLSFPNRATFIEEIRKSEVARLLEKGADYVLVCGAVVPRSFEADLRSVLVAERPEWTGQVRIVAEAELLTWMQSYPSVWVLGPKAERPREWVESSKQWLTRTANKFLSESDREALASEVKELMKGARRSLHVEGSPGVGKTSAVLEALKATPDLAGYCDKFHEEIMALPREPGRTLAGCLVVDECSAEDARRLRDAFTNSSLRIITIAADLESAQHAPALGGIRLEPLHDDTIEQLIQGEAPALSREERARIASLSGGYPKLARLLREARERYPIDGDLQVAVVKLLGDGLTQQAFIALGLPRTFASEDLLSLAKVVGRKKADLVEANRVLAKRGLIGQASERVSYVTPLLLGEILARQFWAAPDAFSDVKKIGDQRLIRSCLERLARIAGDEGDFAKRVLERIGPDELIKAIGPEAAGAFLPKMTTEGSSPTVLNLIRRFLPGLEDPSSWIPALRATLWFPETFGETVQLLARVEGGGKMLVDSFDVALGLTRADGRARAQVLRALAVGCDSERLVAIQCAERICRSDGGQWIPELPEPYDRRWQPKTPEEHIEYRTSGVAILGALIADRTPAVRAAAQNAASHAVRALVRGRLVGLSAELLELWSRSGQPVAPLVAVLNVIETHDRRFIEHASTSEQQRFADARAGIKPKTITDRLSTVAGPASWGEPDLVEIDRVARDALQPDNEVELVADWCFSEDAIVAVEIGKALAKHDDSRRLVAPLLARAQGAKSLRTCAAYFSQLPDVDERIEAWLDDDSLRRLGFETLWLSAPTDRRVELMGRMVEAEPEQSRRFEQLLWGGWLIRANEIAVRDFLARLRKRSPVSAFRLGFQVYFKEHPEAVESYWWDVALEALGETQLTWEWSKVAHWLGARSPAHVGRRLIEALGDETDRDFNPTSEIVPVLSTVTQRAPELVPAVLDLLERMQIFDPEQFAFLANTDQGQLLTWANSLDRARLLVRLLPISSEVVSQLLERFSIGGEMAARLFSGGWTGPESDWVEGIRQQLLQLQKQPLSDKMTGWVAQNLKEAERRKVACERAEHAYELGVIPLPFVADGG